eukprot:TRINITY_DN4379_c0_g1_i1.p1 TRINITY_DN4379_c0_g1~~TRINITY_DN4379_c0_g1_i1.p1  ORF type:complete len:500 (-),score=161.94 TRINITY_DN4379_c0_g1_i1:177-1676(-)
MGAGASAEAKKAFPKMADEDVEKFTKKFEELWQAYEDKMKAGGPESSSDAAIQAFKYNFAVLVSEIDTMMPEDTLEGVDSLPDLEKLEVEEKSDLLAKTVVLKLNGGLGTGMGLDKAKSLLTVSEGNSFLDLIAKQVSHMKKKFGGELTFMLMNSFSTDKDTKEALSKYEDLPKGDDLAFVQNKAPKVRQEDLKPAEWSAAPENEWCPPGHGDLYPAMLGSGALEKLVKAGKKYMFVSNSDNLGATLDLKILSYFASQGKPFMMEVADRTEADKKGGHLAKKKEGGGLTLRESAQCPKADEKAFQDTTKYKYFNTNNLWVDLEKLQELFKTHGGAIPLPVMLNEKTVDPRDKSSTKVFQLETAMGAAISAFEGAIALRIPRSRFAPVKKCDDLVALRSDAYKITEDFRVELDAKREGVPPTVKLDDAYKFCDAMEKLIPNGSPSLVDCKALTVEGGNIEFAGKGVIIKGQVKFVNKSGEKKVVADGEYDGTSELKVVEL